MSTSLDLTSELKQGDTFHPYTEEDIKCDGIMPVEGTALPGSSSLENIFKDKMKFVFKKYLMKIQMLQENKKKQDRKIARLRKELRSLKEKNGVQEAYIDVLCGMIGEDTEEKFRNRQGGNGLKDQSNVDKCRSEIGDGRVIEIDKNLYCIEDITEEHVELC